MTEKRFTMDKSIVDGDYWIHDNLTEFSFPTIPMGVCEIFCEKLNNLAEENEQLKSHINDTQIAVEIETEKCMQRVFDLIDEKIKVADNYRIPIKSLEYGSDLGYWNGVYQYMKKLKKELEE